MARVLAPNNDNYRIFTDAQNAGVFAQVNLDTGYIPRRFPVSFSMGSGGDIGGDSMDIRIHIRDIGNNITGSFSSPGLNANMGAILDHYSRFQKNENDWNRFTRHRTGYTSFDSIWHYLSGSFSYGDGGLFAGFGLWGPGQDTRVRGKEEFWWGITDRSTARGIQNWYGYRSLEQDDPAPRAQNTNRRLLEQRVGVPEDEPDVEVSPQSGWAPFAPSPEEAQKWRDEIYRQREEKYGKKDEEQVSISLPQQPMGLASALSVMAIGAVEQEDSNTTIEGLPEIWSPEQGTDYNGSIAGFFAGLIKHHPSRDVMGEVPRIHGMDRVEEEISKGVTKEDSSYPSLWEVATLRAEIDELIKERKALESSYLEAEDDAPIKTFGTPEWDAYDSHRDRLTSEIRDKGFKVGQILDDLGMDPGSVISPRDIQTVFPRGFIARQLLGVGEGEFDLAKNRQREIFGGLSDEGMDEIRTLFGDPTKDIYYDQNIVLLMKDVSLRDEYRATSRPIHTKRPRNSSEFGDTTSDGRYRVFMPSFGEPNIHIQGGTAGDSDFPRLSTTFAEPGNIRDSKAAINIWSNRSPEEWANMDTLDMPIVLYTRPDNSLLNTSLPFDTGGDSNTITHGFQLPLGEETPTSVGLIYMNPTAIRDTTDSMQTTQSLLMHELTHSVQEKPRDKRIKTYTEYYGEPIEVAARLTQYILSYRKHTNNPTGPLPVGWFEDIMEKVQEGDWSDKAPPDSYILRLPRDKEVIRFMRRTPEEGGLQPDTREYLRYRISYMPHMGDDDTQLA